LSDLKHTKAGGTSYESGRGVPGVRIPFYPNK